jgi:misacylated tRNA(Ala) deacylase
VGGGQPADTGIIEGHRGKAKVIHVQMVNGTVVHIAEEVKGEIRSGEKVKGIVDWGRRYALMKNHTTAHLMAEALRRATGNPLKIVGSAISVDKARLDLAYEKSLGSLLSKIEEAANSIVNENRSVEVKMMKRDEAEEYVKKFHESLETLPPQVEKVRIVEIKGLHACACGGTHVKNTGEIGTVKVLKRRSKGKGVERIEFAAKSQK